MNCRYQTEAGECNLKSKGARNRSILGNLGFQLLQGSELLLGPNVLSEVDLHFFSIEVVVKVKKMDFKKAFAGLVFQGWPDSNVGHAAMGVLAHVRSHRINAIRRKLFVVCTEVCRWET